MAAWQSFWLNGWTTTGTTYTKAGTATLGHDGSGADATTFVETGPGALGLVGSGTKEVTTGVTYTKTGQAAFGLDASGTTAVVSTSLSTGGWSRATRIGRVYTKTGGAVVWFYGSGSPIVSFDEEAFNALLDAEYEEITALFFSPI